MAGTRSDAWSASRSTPRSTGSCPCRSWSRGGSTGRWSGRSSPAGRRPTRSGPRGTSACRARSSRSSAGHAGAWYRDAVAAAGIPLFAVEVASETRTCLSILDESAGTLTELYEAGVTLRPDDWAMVEVALAEALADDPAGAVVVLAGSLPPGAPGDAYRRLAAQVAAAGARAVVDIGGDPFAAALEARPWLVKVNLEEAVVDPRPRRRTGIRSPPRVGSSGAAPGPRSSRSASTARCSRSATGRGGWAPCRRTRWGRIPWAAVTRSRPAGWPGSRRATTWSSACGGPGRQAPANARRPGQGEIDPADVAAFLAGFSVDPVDR